MLVSYAPEVADDLADAREWYEDRSPGLGEDFLRMAYTAFSELSEFPEKHEAVYNLFRRTLLRRFPYSVYYCVMRDAIIVYGVFHSSRNPQAIKKLLEVR